MFDKIKDTCVGDNCRVESDVVSQFRWNLYINTTLLDIKWISPQFKVAFEDEFIPRF